MTAGERATGDRTIEVRIWYLVLALLAEGPKTGYDIIKRLGGLYRRVSPGTIYPVLHRLEEEGLVASREEVVSGRKRRIYSLTERGAGRLLEALDEMLAIVEAATLLSLQALQGLRSRMARSDCGLGGLGEKLAGVAERMSSLAEALGRAAQELRGRPAEAAAEEP